MIVVHVQTPKVSSEGYTTLYDTTMAWIEESREQSKDRQFPNTVKEMKKALEILESFVIREMPSKKRDLSTLSKLDEQLKGQKKTSLPPGYEYAKLEEVSIVTVMLYNP